MIDEVPEIVELVPQQAIAVQGDVPLDELPAFFEKAFRTAAQAAQAAGVHIVGPPFGFYPEPPGSRVAVEAGFPVSGPAAGERLPGEGLPGEVHAMVLPGGRAVQLVHVGPYDTMERSYARLQGWMAESGLRPAGPVWESYLSDPSTVPAAQWRTRIVWPVG